MWDLASSRCKEEIRDVQLGEEKGRPGTMLGGAGNGTELNSELKNSNAFAHGLISSHVWGFCLSGFFHTEVQRLF